MSPPSHFPIFLPKKLNFEGSAPTEDIVVEQKYFNTIVFSYSHNFFLILRCDFRKKVKIDPPYSTAPSRVSFAIVVIPYNFKRGYTST